MRKESECENEVQELDHMDIKRIIWFILCVDKCKQLTLYWHRANRDNNNCGVMTGVWFYDDDKGGKIRKQEGDNDVY